MEDEKVAVNDNKPLNYQHKTRIKRPKIDTFYWNLDDFFFCEWMWMCLLYFFSLHSLAPRVEFNLHFVSFSCCYWCCCFFLYKSVWEYWITNESMTISSLLSLLLFRQTWKKRNEQLSCFIERQWLQQCIKHKHAHKWHIYICLTIKIRNEFCIFISNPVD